VQRLDVDYLIHGRQTMTLIDRPNRRTFLMGAGAAALTGVASAGTPRRSGAARASAAPPASGYDFDTVYNRFGTDCVKFDQQVRIYGKDSVEIGMGIADMDFKAAPAITQALRDRLRHENWGYLDMVRAQEQMAEAIVNWNKRRYGVDIDPATIELATGVHAALISALQTFSPRGSRVLLQTPAYDGFYTDLKFTGTRAEECPLRWAGGRYAMDFEDFERRIGPDTKTFILCNPHNPVGNCWSVEDLVRIGEICLRRGVVVLADEIHCDLVTRGNAYTPFASLKNKDIVNNSLTFKAASKSFSLSAHKIGWFYSTNPDLLARVRENHRADLSTLGLVANVAALTGGEEWLDQAVAYLDRNHDFLQEFVAERIPMVKARKPAATYLVWLDVAELADRIGAKKLALEANRSRPAGGPEETPEKMVERFLVRKAKVQLNAGSNYGLGGANHLRMNIATSRRTLEQALTKMASALEPI
jgi:cysteine-S-conjugate beta-lyase